MAVLADGMGGHSGGSMAAEQVMLTAEQNFHAFKPLHESPEHLLASVVNDAHTVIKLTRFTSEKDPHSTAVVFLLQPGKAHWAHCGDSRMYHFRGRETVSRSVDHSLVADLVRKGRLTEAEAEHHPQRNVLLSCLGGEQEPEIGYGKQAPLMAGDTFLLCSDGLWGYLSDAEMGAAVADMAPREAAQRLISRARERAGGYGDNITVAIVRMVDMPARHGNDNGAGLR